jgi:N utilization substance protein B
MTPDPVIKTKFYSPKIKAKRYARTLAVQALYTYETYDYNIDPSELLIDILAVNDYNLPSPEEKKPIDTKYLMQLVKGAINNLPNLDQKAGTYLAEGWKVERLPKLVRNILRIAIHELLTNTTLKPSMIINDYLEIAKLFMHEGEIGFINSVLDKVALAER